MTIKLSPLAKTQKQTVCLGKKIRKGKMEENEKNQKTSFYGLNEEGLYPSLDKGSRGI